MNTSTENPIKKIINELSFNCLNDLQLNKKNVVISPGRASGARMLVFFSSKTF